MSRKLPTTEPLSFGPADRQPHPIKDAGAIMVPSGGFRWVVVFPGEGEDNHVTLYRERGRLLGGCTCSTWDQHDEPCQHLWAVYLASTESGEADHEALTIREVDSAIGAVPHCPLCGMAHARYGGDA